MIVCKNTARLYHLVVTVVFLVLIRDNLCQGFVTPSSRVPSKRESSLFAVFKPAPPPPPIVQAMVAKEEISVIEALFPFVHNLIITPYQLRKLITFTIQDFSEVKKVIVFTTLGYVIPYIGRFGREIFTNGNFRMSPMDDNYKTTKTYHICNHIKQGFWVASANEIIELLFHGSQALGIMKANMVAKVICNAFKSTSFSIWAMMRMRYYKNFLLKIYLKRKEKDTIYEVWEKSTNYLLYTLTTVVMLDLIGIDYRKALAVVSTFGGVGTLVVGLACKEIATQLVSGISLALEQPFDVGDKIIYGPKSSSGRVEKIGLLYTMVKGTNEVRVKIPNSNLKAGNISNLSRGNRSSVKQHLRFTYDSLKCMPELISAIKNEIQQSCPKLITDGTSPWRVYFNSYENGFLEVIVDARFRIKPRSDEYYQAREEVMDAIGRAMDRCDAKFK